MEEWTQIQEEYISTGISLRQLAAKHGLPRSTLALRASRENWVRQRKERQQEQLARRNTLQTVADKLLHRIEESVDREEALEVKDLKALVSAVKDLVSIRSGCPELERKARIAELEEALGNREGGIEVVFRAGEEEWNG